MTKGNFTSGLRYESYLNALKDYDSQYKGNGIPFKCNFASDGLEITVGNYYEQFGSGLVLRTYEDKGLGVDNASLDGLRLKYSPFNGIYLTSLIGKVELILITQTVLLGNRWK